MEYSFSLGSSAGENKKAIQSIEFNANADLLRGSWRIQFNGDYMKLVVRLENGGSQAVSCAAQPGFKVGDKVMAPWCSIGKFQPPY